MFINIIQLNKFVFQITDQDQSIFHLKSFINKTKINIIFYIILNFYYFKHFEKIFKSCIRENKIEHSNSMFFWNFNFFFLFRSNCNYIVILLRYS
jgi:hypothetical protein